ncbi:MAG: pseudouridine synthase [Eubacteriales bacterium]|nr:pseudouridine synthase [Eubacteriales bacterium]
MRLDRLISQAAGLTRNEARKLIRSGQVTVNLQICWDTGAQTEESSQIKINNMTLDTRLDCHVMMNKPLDVLTAARDSHQKTVMDLLPLRFQKIRCMPVGRLDKDSAGLLLFTTDGNLSHRLLSPQRKIMKEYHALVSGKLDKASQNTFSTGIRLKDFTALPAELVIIRSGDRDSEALVRLHEGKHRQVRRMFQSLGHEVKALSRLAFGPIRLDASLPPGSWRELRPEEFDLLKEAAGLG